MTQKSKPQLILTPRTHATGRMDPTTLAYQGACHPDMDYDGGLNKYPAPQGIQASTPATSANEPLIT